MNWNAISFDWNQVRAFLASAEEGSLSAAARALGQTQPTLSRQVTSLEAHLGVVLFERSRRQTRLTPAGLDLLEHVRVMAQAANRVSLSAAGHSQEIDGHVSVTATEMMVAYVLTRELAKLRIAAPKIDVEFRPSNDLSDLLKRDADIAIRHARPDQDDLIAKCVATSAAHFYCTSSYLEHSGAPENLDALATHDFLGLSPIERFLPSIQVEGLNLTAKQFKFTTASGCTLIEMARQGLGIAILPRHIANQFVELVPVLPELVSVPIPIWLVAHRELRTSQRIRLVFDHLAESVGRLG